MSSEFELYYAEDQGQPLWFRFVRDNEGKITEAAHGTILQSDPLLVEWIPYVSDNLEKLEEHKLYQVLTGKAFDVALIANTTQHSLMPDNATPSKDPAVLAAKKPKFVSDKINLVMNYYYDQVLRRQPLPKDFNFNKLESIHYALQSDDPVAVAIKNRLTQIFAKKDFNDWLTPFNAQVQAEIVHRREVREEAADLQSLPAPNAQDFTDPDYWYTTDDADGLLDKDFPRASFRTTEWACKFTNPNRHAYYLPSMLSTQVDKAFFESEFANYLKATNGAPAAERAFGFLINVDNNKHWPAMTVNCSGWDAAQKKYTNVVVTFFDSAESEDNPHLTPAIKTAVQEAFGVAVIAKTERRQPGGSDCGPLAVNFVKTVLQQKEDNARVFTAAMVAELRRSQQAQLLAVSSETATHKLNAKAEPGIPGKMVSSEWLDYFRKVDPKFTIKDNKAVYATELTFGEGKHQKKAPVSVSIDANGSAVISLPKGQMIPSAILDISLKAFIMAQLKRAFPTRSAEDLEKILNDKAECLKHIKSVMIDADDANVRQQMSDHAKSFGLIVEDPSPAVAAPIAPELAAEEAPTHAPGI